MRMPKKWTDVYPHGSKEGDDEQKFFIALARHPKLTWRSSAALARETGLTTARVNEIIQEYLRSQIVLTSPGDENEFAYWERHPEFVAGGARNKP